MKCPSCNNQLSQFDISAISVYACDGGCGGFWFDRDAIKKLKQCPHSSGKSLFTINRALGIRSFRDVTHICPKCTTTLLYRHFFDKNHEYEINQCAKCGGFWIDVGILADIPLSQENANIQDSRIKDYFYTLFREKMVSMDLTKLESVEAAQNIIQIFEFLSPKEWITEKPKF